MAQSCCIMSGFVLTPVSHFTAKIPSSSLVFYLEVPVNSSRWEILSPKCHFLSGSLQDLCHSHSDEATIQQKISIIISCFISSSMPPALQVDIPPEQAQQILEKRRELGPYIFREAQVLCVCVCCFCCLLCPLTLSLRRYQCSTNCWGSGRSSRSWETWPKRSSSSLCCRRNGSNAQPGWGDRGGRKRRRAGELRWGHADQSKGWWSGRNLSPVCSGFFFWNRRSWRGHSLVPVKKSRQVTKREDVRKGS